MAEYIIIICAAILHVMITLAFVPIARKKGRRVASAHVAFMLALPVFGAVVSMIFALSGDPDPESRKHLERNADVHQSLINPTEQSSLTVPMEEAFLINEPRKRRAMMLNMLHNDPRQYIDLLLLARFNEDPETAHYATATLSEVQRKIQLELQQLQANLAENPQDAQTRLEYIELLHAYVESGLLEGRLLERQRYALRHALESMPDEAVGTQLSAMEVDNLLELNEPGEALIRAERMVERWPGDENAYLTLLHVHVKIRDDHGVAQLKQRLAQADVHWTRAGLERMQYFIGRTE